VTEDRDLLRQRIQAMSPEERAARNQAIKDRAAAGLAKCREVSPAAVQRFKEKIQNYPLTGKAAWLVPHRERISDWVVTTYRCGNDNADLDDLRQVRFHFAGVPLSHAQAQQLLRLAAGWLRQLHLVSSVRLSKQLNGPSGKTEDSGPLDWIKPL
jgi:hypothetical protein